MGRLAACACRRAGVAADGCGDQAAGAQPDAAAIARARRTEDRRQPDGSRQRGGLRLVPRCRAPRDRVGRVRAGCRDDHPAGLESPHRDSHAVAVRADPAHGDGARRGKLRMLRQQGTASVGGAGGRRDPAGPLPLAEARRLTRKSGRMHRPGRDGNGRRLRRAASIDDRDRTAHAAAASIHHAGRARRTDPAHRDGTREVGGDGRHDSDVASLADRTRRAAALLPAAVRAVGRQAPA